MDFHVEGFLLASALKFCGGNKMNGQRNRFGEIPVKEGDTYDVEIEGIGEKGDGIARVNGYVIIVPNVQKGEKVKVKVNAVRGKVSFGEVIGEGSGTAESQDEESIDKDADEEAPSEDDPEDTEEETAEEDAEEQSEETNDEEPQEDEAAEDEETPAEESEEEDTKKEE